MTPLPADTPGPLCRALSVALQSATPWWARVRVESRPGGYELRVRLRRPPHFGTEGMRTAHRGAAARHAAVDPAESVREILATVQHCVGRELGVAWPTSIGTEPS